MCHLDCPRNSDSPVDGWQKYRNSLGYVKECIEVSLLGGILKLLLMGKSNARELASQVQNNLKLNQASLKQLGLNTKVVIRLLARKAKASDKRRIVNG